MREIKYNNIWETITKEDYFLYIFLGGRGIGKTYSSLLGALYSSKPFMYLRRTENEIKNCCNEKLNPFKVINNDKGRDIHLVPTGDSYTILEEDNVLGYASALSTFGKFRSVDFSDVETIIFDEFINTSSHNTIKNESVLLFNLIETVGRNRELQGRKPLKIILLSNTNTIENEILTTLEVASELHKMKSNKESVYRNKEKGLYVELLKNNDFVELKKETCLYKLTEGTEFYNMALNNDFSDMVFNDVYKIHYQRLKPFISFKNTLYFYDVKATNKVYISNRKASCKNIDDLKEFKKLYIDYLDTLSLNNDLIFCDYNVRNKYTLYFH